MSKPRPSLGRAYLASGGLILFNAATFYEILVPSQPGLKPIGALYNSFRSWRRAMDEAFLAAFEINYHTVFLYSRQVLDALPASPVVERALQNLYLAAQSLASNASLLRHDITGRIYHRMLAQELQKAYATYYTSIPAAELLCWLSIDDSDSKVVDFACGSGTLIVGAYRRKLTLAPTKGEQNIQQLHSRFIQSEIWGFDAMPFASHLSMVNLALQQPTIPFRTSRLFNVPCVPKIGKHAPKLGSLDLLTSSKLELQKTFTGPEIGSKRQTLEEVSIVGIRVTPDFDLVVMNPPFTRSDRITKALDTSALSKILNKLCSEYGLPEITIQAGLAAPFLLLADKYLAKGGRMAFVLPSAVLSRDTWEPLRSFLVSNYHVEYVIVSWAYGRPNFSENTELREILLVARKHLDNTAKFDQATTILHLDELPNYLEARELGERLRRMSAKRSDFDVLSRPEANLTLGLKTYGGATSVQSRHFKRLQDNWYRFVAFRSQWLVRLALGMRGGFEITDAPSQLPPADLLTNLADIASVGSVVDHTESIGLDILDAPRGQAIPALMTSDHDCLRVDPSDYEWLSWRRGVQPRPIDTANLLLPRRIDIYNTMSVSATISDEPIASNVWWPVQPSAILRSSEGSKIEVGDAAKVISLWLNSTLGLITLLSEREETRGAWTEWKKGRWEQVKVLDVRKLSRRQIQSLSEKYDGLKSLQFEKLHEQLRKSGADMKHPRRELDGLIAATLGKTEGIDSFFTKVYSELLDTLEKLRDLMK